MAQMKGNTSDLLYGYIKQMLKKIDSGMEETAKQNSVQQSAPNTTQTVYTLPTTNSMEIARNAPQSINQYNAQQESKKKREEKKAANTVDTSKMTDEQIISKYESIPEHNVLARTFSSKKSDEYDQKQSMLSAYQKAKRQQISNFMSENGISYDDLNSVFEKDYNYSAYSEEEKRKHSANIKAPDEIDNLYSSIRSASDKAGIDINDIKKYYGALAAGEFSEKARDYADNHEILGTVASIGTNIMGGLGNFVVEKANYISGRPLNSNEEANAVYDITSKMRGAVKENISDSIENPTLDSIANLGYDAVSSAGDTVASAVLFGKAGALPVMSIISGTNTLKEAKDRNLTPDQMMGTAIASGAIEAITEKIPLDNLFKIAKTQGRQSVKQILKNALKQAGTEASEEAVSELANTFVDNVINEDESVFNQSVNQYMIMYGLTRAQAENKAREDIAARTLQSALAGAVSGGIMAGGAGVIANANSDIITPEQFQANNEYIQKLQSINEGQNYLDSYNNRVEKVPDMRYLSTFQNGVSSDSQNNSDTDAYAKMLDRVQAVPRYNSVQNDTFIPTHYENGNGVEQYSVHDATNLTSQKGVTSRDKSFSDFVNESLSGNYGKDTMNYYLGTVSEELANDIYDKTGIDVENFNIHMSSDNIIHTFNDHSNANVESKKNQVALNADLISKLPQVFDNPDNISLSSNTDGRGRKVIMFEKRINGKIIVAEAISGGKHRLSLDTMYIKNSHPTGVDAINTPQPLRPKQSVGKAVEAVNQSLDARAPQDTSENAAENTAFVKDSIPNSGENVNEGSKNVQYNGKKIDGFDDLNRDLDRLIGMYKGNENTQNLYEQMKSALNEYVQTYNQDAIDRALTLASDIDGTLVGHSYTRKGSGKNSSKSQNNRVTTDFAEGDFIDTLLSYTNELRNMAKTNYESEKQNHNVNTAPVRNTYVEQTAQFGDKVSQTRTNTIENSGLASDQELKNYHAPEKFTYEQISEENSLNKATEKLNKYGQDYVNDILSSDNQNISGVDIDALMMEYRRLTESARKNGSDADWIRAQDILKKIQVASTRNAQALQALAKWSRNTPEGQLAQANTAIEQTIEKKFGRKRTENTRDAVESVYEAAKSGSVEKLEYALDKLNISENGIKQIELQLQNNQNVTRNTVIELLANEGKINKKLAESIKEDTATQRKVLDMLEQMYDVGVDTYEGQVIMARVGKLLSSKVQHTVGDKVRQILYNNMLGNFRTLISRNAGGNVAVATMEQARQPLAATIDRAVSHFTGKRTTTGWSKEKQLSYIKGFAKGITEEFRDVKNTLSEYKNGQSTGLHTAKSGENNIINAIKNNDSAFKGNNILSKFINFKNDMVKHGLSMGDRPFYESTKAQAKTEIKQLLKQGYDIDTDELNLDEYIEQASSLIALEAVYQGDTVLSKGFQGLRKDLSEITKGMIGVDIMSMPIVPFVKTPSNVLDMAIEYSPFGFIKNIANTAIETKKGDGFNQRRFVDETSRNIVGTLLMSACVLAYSAGKFTGGYDEDKDVRNAQKSAGMQEYALSFDDGKKNFDVGWVPVLGSSVEAGAAFGDAYKDGSGFLGATGAAMGQTAQSVFDQSMLESLSNLLGNNSYKDENFLTNAGKSIVGSALGMTTSSLGRQIAQSTDKYERNLGTYGTNEYYINSVLNSIPGARQLLDIKYDNEGKPVQQNQGRGIGSKLLENMLLPGKVTDVNYSDLSKESIRLFESTGEKKQFVPTASQSDIKNDNFTPTTEEFNEYKRVLGENNSYGSAALMDSEFYQKLSDEEKVKYLSNIFSDMKMLAKKEIVLGYEFPEDDKKKMEIYDEAGIDGLVDYYSVTNQRGDKTGINPTMSAIDNLDATEEEKGYYADKFLKPSASDSDKTALKKHNDVMKKYGYEGIYTYYTIKSRVDENDTSNAAKVSAVDSVDLSDEDKGYYLSKMVDVSKSASEIQNSYGDAGLYKWYSLRSKADSDGNGNISNAEMVNQIIQTDMSYDDMLNYASVLYEDGKEKTAREKAVEAIQDAQRLNRIDSIINGHKSAKSGNYQSNKSSLERIEEIINSRYSSEKVSNDDSLKRIQSIIDNRNARLLTPLN